MVVSSCSSRVDTRATAAAELKITKIWLQRAGRPLVLKLRVSLLVDGDPLFDLSCRLA